MNELYHIYGTTTSPSGRKQTMSRWFYLKPDQTIKQGIMDQLNKRKDKGYAFLGCLIYVASKNKTYEFILENEFSYLKLV